jgi:hypothetical protein
VGGPPPRIEPGEQVRIRHLGQVGTVLSDANAQGMVEVQLPVGKTRVPVGALSSAGPALPRREAPITWTAGAGEVSRQNQRHRLYSREAASAWALPRGCHPGGAHAGPDHSWQGDRTPPPRRRGFVEGTPVGGGISARFVRRGGRRGHRGGPRNAGAGRAAFGGATRNRMRTG